MRWRWYSSDISSLNKLLFFRIEDYVRKTFENSSVKVPINIVKLFFFITDGDTKRARASVDGEVWLVLYIASEVKAYCKGAPNCALIRLPPNIRQAWKTCLGSTPVFVVPPSKRRITFYNIETRWKSSKARKPSWRSTPASPRSTGALRVRRDTMDGSSGSPTSPRYDSN